MTLIEREARTQSGNRSNNLISITTLSRSLSLSISHIKMYVSMIRKYHNHQLQINHWHREEELHDIYSNKTYIKAKQTSFSSLSR